MPPTGRHRPRPTGSRKENRRLCPPRFSERRNRCEELPRRLWRRDHGHGPSEITTRTHCRKDKLGRFCLVYMIPTSRELGKLAWFSRQQPWPSIPEVIFDDVQVLHRDPSFGLLFPVALRLRLGLLNWLCDVIGLSLDITTTGLHQLELDRLYEKYHLRWLWRR